MGGDGPDESARTLGSGGYHSVQDCASSVVRSVVGVSLRILEELQSQPKAHGAASFASMGIRLDRAFVVSEAVRKVRSTAERNTTRRDAMANPACEIQAARTRAEYARAKDNIEWLSGPSPAYACGERVAKYDVYHLLGLNRSIVEYIEKNCRHHLE